MTDRMWIVAQRAATVTMVAALAVLAWETWHAPAPPTLDVDRPPPQFVPHYTPASDADAARFLMDADHIMAAFMDITECSTPRGDDPTCIVALGEGAARKMTGGYRDVLLGPWAGYDFTIESDRVVISSMFECDVVVRRCWYLSDWRPRQVATISSGSNVVDGSRAVYAPAERAAP